MNATKQVFRVCVLMGVVALLAAFALERYWWGWIPVLVLGILGWIGGNAQRWTWIVHIFLVGVTVLVILGALIRFNLVLLLLIIISALAVWDLARFQQRMQAVPSSQETQRIEKRHLGLLGLTLGGSGILTIVVLNVQVQISFGIALALAVLLIIILGQAYRFLKTDG